MTKYLLLLLLLLNLPAISQTTTPKHTQTPSEVCIPVEQARVITTSLQKYEILKPAYVKLENANKELRTTNTHYKQSMVDKDSALAISQRSVGNLQMLYTDSKVKADVWEKKAHRNGLRFWLLAVATAIVGGVAITH